MNHPLRFVFLLCVVVLGLWACGPTNDSPPSPADQDASESDSELGEEEQAPADGDRESEPEALAERDSEAEASVEAEREIEPEAENESASETEAEAESVDDDSGINPADQPPATCTAQAECADGLLCVKGECVACGKHCADGEYCVKGENGVERCVIRPCGFPPVPSEAPSFSLETTRREWLRLSRHARLWGFAIDPASETLHVVTSDTAPETSAPETAVILTHSWTSLAPSAQSLFADDFFGAPKAAEGQEEIARVSQALIDGPWLGYAQTAKQYALRFDAKGDLRFMASVLDATRQAVPIWTQTDAGWEQSWLSLGTGQWVKVFQNEKGQATAVRFEAETKELVLTRETPEGPKRVVLAALTYESEFSEAVRLALAQERLFFSYRRQTSQADAIGVYSWFLAEMKNDSISRNESFMTWLAPLGNPNEYSSGFFPGCINGNASVPIALSPVDDSTLFHQFIVEADSQADCMGAYYFEPLWMRRENRACIAISSGYHIGIMEGMPGYPPLPQNAISEIRATFDPEGHTHITWRVNDSEGERRYYATDRFGAWATIRISPDAAPQLEDGLFDATGRFLTPRLKDAPDNDAQSILYIESTNLAPLSPAP